jgi:hypothetical protein
MKARVKTTGEIVEVIPYSGFDDYDYYDPETKLPWFKSQLSFDVTNSDPDYWTRLEHQYAGMAMQGLILTASKHMGTDQDVAQWAKECAHALVEKLKEKEEK